MRNNPARAGMSKAAGARVQEQDPALHKGQSRPTAWRTKKDTARATCVPAHPNVSLLECVTTSLPTSCDDNDMDTLEHPRKRTHDHDYDYADLNHSHTGTRTEGDAFISHTTSQTVAYDALRRHSSKLPHLQGNVQVPL